MNRRLFIKKATAVVAAGMALPMSAEETKIRKKPIGLQLYSVRADLAKDLHGTLRKLSEIGYSNMEAAGYRNDRLFYKQKPADFKKIIEDLGMKFTGSHTGTALLAPQDQGWDFWKAAMEDHAIAGTKWVVQASYPVAQIKTKDDVKRLADQFNQTGSLAGKAGLRFAYHNHEVEFNPLEGIIPYELLIESTDPGLVSFQVDTAHMIAAGSSCTEYIQKYPGRFANWHLMDLHKTKNQSTELGTGRVDFEAIFALRKQAGMEDYFVEQEAYSFTPLESVKMDYEFLMKARYVK